MIYLDLSSSDSKSATLRNGSTRTLLDAKLDMRGWIWTLAGAYRAWSAGGTHVDLFGGARLLTLDLDLKLTGGGPRQRSRSPSRSVDLWDGIVGAKGRVALQNAWFVPYYLDVGTGDSDLTWQAAAGLGYAFDWGEITLMYRHLAYDQSAGKPLQNVAFSGGMLGVGFRF